MHSNQHVLRCFPLHVSCTSEALFAPTDNNFGILKRRASSMDPEPDSHDKDALENNTDMAQTLPRAMSLDPLETTQTEMINGLSGSKSFNAPSVIFQLETTSC